MNDKNGGPAFPEVGMTFIKTVGTDEIVAGKTVQPGMSLRDYFAAKAMQALIGNSSLCDTVEPPSKEENVYSWFTVRAFGIADAMLAERATNQNPTPRKQEAVP